GTVETLLGKDGPQRGRTIPHRLVPGCHELRDQGAQESGKDPCCLPHRTSQLLRSSHHQWGRRGPDQQNQNPQKAGLRVPRFRIFQTATLPSSYSEVLVSRMNLFSWISGKTSLFFHAVTSRFPRSSARVVMSSGNLSPKISPIVAHTEPTDWIPVIIMKWFM